MAKPSLFNPDDLQTAKAPVCNVFKIADFKSRKALEEIATSTAMIPSTKRKKYGVLNSGILAIARVQLSRTAGGGFNIIESKGAKWIDVKFILEGRYNNRFIFSRFMLSGASESTRQLVKETRKTIQDILSCAGVDLEARASATDGVRVPVCLTAYPRFGDGKMTNGVQVLSADPSSPSYPFYLQMLKKRKVTNRVDSLAENMDNEIDMPGWMLRPGTPAASIGADKIASRKEKCEKAIDRSMSKMMENSK